MGSLVMHLCIGKKIAKELGKSDIKEFMIGNLAPDLSKVTDQSKYISHFLKKIQLNGVEAEVPDIDKFLAKYKGRLDDSFVQGYLCHLLSDDLWYRDYIPNHVMAITEDKNQILLRDIDDYIPYGDFRGMVYRDYARINPYLFELYKINLKRFDDMDIEDPEMKEFEYNKIHKLIEEISFYLDYDSNSAGNIENTDLELLSQNESITYIEQAAETVISKFKEIGVLN